MQQHYVPHLLLVGVAYPSRDRLLLVLEGVALLRDAQQWDKGSCLERVG